MFIDEANTALDIFRMLPSPLCGIFFIIMCMLDDITIAGEQVPQVSFKLICSFQKAEYCIEAGMQIFLRILLAPLSTILNITGWLQ